MKYKVTYQMAHHGLCDFTNKPVEYWESYKDLVKTHKEALELKARLKQQPKYYRSIRISKNVKPASRVKASKGKRIPLLADRLHY